MILHGDALSLHIGAREILREVSITVTPGRVSAALGPNGAGKTTLLRLLCGELAPSRGSVALNGCALRDWPIEARARVRAVMPHETQLSFAFTAEDVVRLGRLPHENLCTSQHNRWVTHEALRAVDAFPLARRRFPELSAGERQRVALARAIAQIWDEQPTLGPRYLLLDEPTSHLDVGHQLAIMERVRALAAGGVGVIAVMHDLNLAAQFADEVVLLHAGQVLAAGTPERAITADIIERAYGIVPVMLTHPQTHRPVVLPGAGPAPHP